MTVKELREQLAKFPDHMDVYFPAVEDVDFGIFMVLKVEQQTVTLHEAEPSKVSAEHEVVMLSDQPY